MTSYSQLGQDLEVVKFYNGSNGSKTQGFFIEIGANDGIKYSDTYLLETKYNWSGICIEAIPEKLDILRRNRPMSVCYNETIFSQSDIVVKFDIANSYDLLSGISDYIVTHKETVDSDKTTIDVRTLTLNDLLKDFPDLPTTIDYMSLDTEGSELEILKSIDFGKYTFGLIDVEHNYVEPNRSEIRKLLLANGYEYIRENQWDDCYKHNSVSVTR